MDASQAAVSSEEPENFIKNLKVGQCLHEIMVFMQKL